jgi:hypothetical protein
LAHSLRSSCSVGTIEDPYLTNALSLGLITATTIDYLDSGKIRTKGIVNKTFKLEQFGDALESIMNKSAIKAAIVFD